MLDCCAPLERVKVGGMTFEEFACLARCNGLTVTTRRPAPLVGKEEEEEEEEEEGPAEERLSLSKGDATFSGRTMTVKEFRDAVKESCTGKLKDSCSRKHGSESGAGGTCCSEEDCLRIACISYDRSVLGQTGTGHFSPIGAYHAKTDQVLILDVARFKYPPHWASLKEVFCAMRTLDKDTGLPRGLAVLSKDAACCDMPTFFGWKNSGSLGKEVLDYATRVRRALRREETGGEVI